MRIELKNIGMLKEAIVKIDGLTVIAGENDAGKSTVGKVLFCIIKAIGKYQEYFQESKDYKIQEKLEALLFYIRRKLEIKHTKKFDDLWTMVYLKKYKDKNKIYKHINNIKKIISEILDKEEDESINILIKNLESIVEEPENKQQSIENALIKIFRSEFNSNILYYAQDSGYIKLYENDLILLDIEINKDNKIKLKNKVEPIEINEATFIETPLILNNHDLLIQSQTGLDLSKSSSRRLGIPYTTLHTKDLFDKLKLFNFEDKGELDNIKDDISKIINGKIIYDNQKKDFLYIKINQTIPIKNTATGIKSFGIIQILLDNDFINRKSILILDEPEIHLHPKWQLEYAKIISILARNDIPILITSHSPYIIEALKRYSDIENLEKKTNFYLSKDKIIKDENNLSEIFELLSEPFEDFRKMDSDILRDE